MTTDPIPDDLRAKAEPYAKAIVAKLSAMNDQEAAHWLALNYPIDEIAIALIIAVFRAAQNSIAYQRRDAQS